MIHIEKFLGVGGLTFLAETVHKVEMCPVAKYQVGFYFSYDLFNALYFVILSMPIFQQNIDELMVFVYFPV